MNKIFQHCVDNKSRYIRPKTITDEIIDIGGCAMVEKISSQHPVTTSRTHGITNQLKEDLRHSFDEKTVTQNQKEQKEVGKEQVQEVVQALNDFLSPTYTALKFTMHDKLGEYYVQVIDEETEEVIREVPPKKMLDLYAAMAERLGIIIDEKI